jgi:uncharacterized protein DUF692
MYRQGRPSGRGEELGLCHRREGHAHGTPPPLRYPFRRFSSSTMDRSDFAPLGFGVGLRRPHYVRILEQHPPMDWFEVISENLMVEGGRPLEVLEDVRAHYPIVMHGVSLSIGSTDPLDLTYLYALREAVRRFEPAWVSDHLCWTGAVTICTTSCHCPTPRRPCSTSLGASGKSRTFSSTQS